MSIKFRWVLFKMRWARRKRIAISRAKRMLICSVVGHDWFNSTSWSGVSETCRRCWKFHMIRRSTVIQ